MSEATLPVPCEVCGVEAGHYCITVSRRFPLRRQRAAGTHQPRLIAIVRCRHELQESA